VHIVGHFKHHLAQRQKKKLSIAAIRLESESTQFFKCTANDNKILFTIMKKCCKGFVQYTAGNVKFYLPHLQQVLEIVFFASQQYI
jgi:hypothetical protein